MDRDLSRKLRIHQLLDRVEEGWAHNDKPLVTGLKYIKRD